MTYNMNKRIYKTVWTDGYICNIVCDNGWRLEGKKLLFKSLDELEEYYKGRISTFERIE